MTRNGSISTPAVIAAFTNVDRGHFIDAPEHSTEEIRYINSPFRNGAQHLSAPCIYATAMEGLELSTGCSFLNVCSGTGYLSALVSQVVGTKVRLAFGPLTSANPIENGAAQAAQVRSGLRYVLPRVAALTNPPRVRGRRSTTPSRSRTRWSTTRVRGWLASESPTSSSSPGPANLSAQKRRCASRESVRRACRRTHAPTRSIWHAPAPTAVARWPPGVRRPAFHHSLFVDASLSIQRPLPSGLHLSPATSPLDGHDTCFGRSRRGGR